MTDLQSRLLETLLPLVPFDGWSDYALTQAGRNAGLGLPDAKMAFPGGIADCIDFYFRSADEKLARDFPEGTLSGKRMPDRIETLLMAKLAHFALHKEAVRRAVAQRALPWNLPRATKSLYASVDNIWRLAGDSSIDFSFYTKRMTLAGLYTSTLLFWLNDESDNMDATRAFMQRRLADIAAFGKKKKAFKEKMRMA